MINVDYKGVVIGELSADTDATLVPGRAVELDSGDVSSATTAGCRVLGLVKEAQISGTVDEVSGDYGIYGSGKVSVVMSGIVTVQQSSYNGVSNSVYDESKTYAVNDRIYADQSVGKLTNVMPTAGNVTDGLTSAYIGRVLSAPTNPANGDAMQITVDCLG